MKLKSRGTTDALFLAILVCSATLTKGQRIVDQGATPSGDQFMSLVGGGVGQEFRPTLTSLDFVELRIGSMFMDDAGTLLVRIREGTLDGPILGLSEPVTLDYQGEPLIAHFSFAQSVALIPGETYVLEVPDSGPPYQGWGASMGPTSYDRGRVVYNYGASLPDQDFWFREGILIVPEITGASMLPDGSFQFVFSGTPGASFSVLATTNAALPSSSWAALYGVLEVSPGQFQFTDWEAITYRQRFYRVRSP